MFTALHSFHSANQVLLMDFNLQNGQNSCALLRIFLIAASLDTRSSHPHVRYRDGCLLKYRHHVCMLIDVCGCPKYKVPNDCLQHRPSHLSSQIETSSFRPPTGFNASIVCHLILASNGLHNGSCF
jgi:hypothetical protein